RRYRQRSGFVAVHPVAGGFTATLQFHQIWLRSRLCATYQQLCRILSQMQQLRRAAALSLLYSLVVTLSVRPAAAYSVLTHEQIIDLAWEPHLKPMLMAKFPATTLDQLNEAHAYAYGEIGRAHV